jgi:hypothetical protein
MSNENTQRCPTFSLPECADQSPTQGLKNIPSMRRSYTQLTRKSLHDRVGRGGDTHNHVWHWAAGRAASIAASRAASRAMSRAGSRMCSRAGSRCEKPAFTHVFVYNLLWNFGSW